MERLNWNIFELKFEGKQEAAFEDLARGLFCSEHQIKNGLSGYKNHPGLETNPVKIGSKFIGFQAKYSSPSVILSAKKQHIINSIRIAKENEKLLDVIYIYVNKQPSSSSIKGKIKPNYLNDIEKEAIELGVQVVWKFSDHIANELSQGKNLKLAKSYFPEFIEKNAALLYSELNNINELLNISRTAHIQIDIAKLKFEFTTDWDINDKIINQFQVYVDFRNEIIASDIFDFINYNVSSATRSNMPTTIAHSIYSLVLAYFPSSYENGESKLRFSNGKQCIDIGFNMVYDSFVYTNNFKIAQLGLTIWKFVYRESKRNNMPELVDAVLSKYEELERTLDRPTRNDLENAKELVQIFKADLDTYSLVFPFLPEHLYELTKRN